MLVITNIYHIYHKVYTRLFLLTQFRNYVAGRCGKNRDVCKQAWFLGALKHDQTFCKVKSFFDVISALFA